MIFHQRFWVFFFFFLFDFNYGAGGDYLAMFVGEDKNLFTSNRPWDSSLFYSKTFIYFYLFSDFLYELSYGTKCIVLNRHITSN